MEIYPPRDSENYLITLVHKGSNNEIFCQDILSPPPLYPFSWRLLFTFHSHIIAFSYDIPPPPLPITLRAFILWITSMRFTKQGSTLTTARLPGASKNFTGQVKILGTCWRASRILSVEISYLFCNQLENVKPDEYFRSILNNTAKYTPEWFGSLQ